MEESDIEGVAIHGGPESCVSHPQGGDEALTGGVQARLSSREIPRSGCPRRPSGGRQHRGRRYVRVASEPRAVTEPGHVRKLHAREPGEPIIARLLDQWAGRSEKAEAISPR